MSTADNATVHTQGGATHLTISSDSGRIEAGSGSRSVNGNVHNSGDRTYHLGSGGSQMQTQGYQEVNISDTYRHADNPLDTAINGAFPAFGNLTPESVIKVGGMEMTIAGAQQLGMVRQTATGYEWKGPMNNGVDVKKTSDASVSTTQAPRQSDQQQSPLEVKSNEPVPQDLPQGVELFHPEVETKVTQAVQAIPESIRMESAARIIEGGIESLASLNYDNIARASGISTEEASQKVATVIQAFSDQANNIAKSMGIGEPQEVWDWLTENRPEALKHAQRELAFGRDTRTLRALITDAKHTLGPNESSLQKAGYETSRNAEGELMVRIGGAWMLSSVAMKAELI